MSNETKMLAVTVPEEWMPAITRKRNTLSISKWLRSLIKTAIDPRGKLGDVNDPGRPTSEK